MQWLLRQQDGQPFRAVVQASPARIMNLANGSNKVRNAVLHNSQSLDGSWIFVIIIIIIIIIINHEP